MLRGSTLRRRLARTLEGEAGFNDPVAVLLVLGFIDWIQKPDYGLADMVLLFVAELGIGAAVGLAVGWLSAAGRPARVRLATAGLYPVATLAIAALAFGGADVAARLRLPRRLPRRARPRQRADPRPGGRRAFHEGLAWVAQLGMFLTLGLLVFPSPARRRGARGHACSRSSSWSWRGRSPRVATAFAGFGAGERVIARLGGPARRGARWCSPPSR